MTSRFSLLSSSSSVSKEKRKSIVDLNKELEQEVTSVHCFFGPKDQTVTKPRVLHGPRRIELQGKKAYLISEPIANEKESSASKKRNSLTDKLSAASRFVGRKVANMTNQSSSFVHQDSFCDGCAMDPIVGFMWSCSDCENVHLCDSCYSCGVHGFEQSQIMKQLRQTCAIATITELSKQRVPEQVFELLMTKVCKGQIDKFNFLANWISQVVLGNELTSVRGIEIPNLDDTTRSTLVHLLTPVLTQRSDIQVNMEWTGLGSRNLKIWIASEKDDSSPFISSTKESPDGIMSPNEMASPCDDDDDNNALLIETPNSYATATPMSPKPNTPQLNL